MLPEQKLDVLLARHAELEAALGSQQDSDTYVRLSRELAELEPVVASIKAYRAASKEMAELQALLDDPKTEPDMRALADSERGPLQERLVQLRHEVQLALVPKDAMDARNVIIEI